MNNFLIEQLTINLDVEEKMEFIRKCKCLLLNDEIFTKQNYRINHIELTFNLLVSICNYYINNSSKNNTAISKRLKEIDLKRIYFLARKNLNEQEKEENKILITNLYKEYYEICEKCNWNEDYLKLARRNSKFLDILSNNKFTFNEIVILNESRIEQIIEYGNFYSKTILGKNRSKKIRQLINTDRYELFNMLLNEKNDNKIIEYLVNNYKELNVNSLKVLIPNFIQNYSIVENIIDKNELNKIEKELEIKLETTISTILAQIKEKLNRQKKSKKDNKNQEKETYIERAEKNITMFLEGEYRNIKHYCSENHVGISSFKEYIKVVEEENKELYYEVKERLTFQSSIKKTNINDELLKIVDYIKNGVILKDGSTKEFDILDCFIVTDIPLIKMRCLLNKSNLSYEDLKIIRDFLNKYRNCQKITIDSIYKERNIILIDNKQYEVDIKEKEKVIEYLVNNSIPLLNVTYNLALKRLLSGKLVQKEKILKK